MDFFVVELLPFDLTDESSASLLWEFEPLFDSLAVAVAVAAAAIGILADGKCEWTNK